MSPSLGQSILAAALTALLLPGASARADVLLGNSVAGSLYDVNTSTGAATNARSTGINSLVGIAFRADGALFGLTTFGGTPNPSALFSINPTTGASTLVGSTGLSSIFEGDLAFDPTSNTLYGLQNVPTVGLRELFTINTSTGAAAVVGDLNLPASDLSAMAFDAAGNLYVIDTGGKLLLRVNKSTAAVTNSVSMSTQLGNAAGMAFSPTTGAAYVADGAAGGTNTLYTLNLTTGALAPVGGTGGANGLAGLSFVPPLQPSVPEPSTLALGVVTAGLLGLGGWMRSRRVAA
jgi:DNA-binding beta-propeller fold protein YncE